MAFIGSSRERTLRVCCLYIGLLAYIGLLGALPATAGVGRIQQDDAAARYSQALAIFNSERQPESIPLFSELIDRLRANPSRDDEATELLALSLLHRAQARLNLGQDESADADLQEILRVSPSFQIPADLARSTLSPRLLERFEGMGPALGFLHIVLTPPDARVIVDGQEVDARTPFSVTADSHTIFAEYDGYGPETRQVSVTAGQTTPVEINLQRLPRRPLPMPRRVTVGINRGFHVGINPESTSSTEFVYFGGSGSFDTQYPRLVIEPGFTHRDFGAAVRVRGRLALGFNYSQLETIVDASIDGQVPYPSTFLVRPDRSLSGFVPGLKLKEQTFHIEVRGTTGSQRFEAAWFAGPSFFRLNQEVVFDVSFRDRLSFVDFIEADIRERQQESAFGYNVGADFAYMVIPYVGVGGFVRYSYADVEFAEGVQSGKFILGGLQTGFGLRLRF